MRKLTDDRGAVAVLTAILASAVLFAFGAFAVDVASLYNEFRQVQNGADAAAGAVAQTCAKGSCDSSRAATYANNNANDNTTNVVQVCGGNGAALPACTAKGSQQSSCPAPSGVAASAPYVQVVTSTKNSDGTTLLPPSFAGAIPGNATYNGTRVVACARVAYGVPTSLTSILPITIAKCAWDAYVASYPTFAPPPPYSPSVTSYKQYDTVLYTKGKNDCATNQPGNFDMLVSSSCQITTVVNQYVSGDPGNDLSGCGNVLNANLGKIVYLPIYDNAQGTGNNVTYHIVGYAAVFLTGWNLSSSTQNSIATGKAPCSGSNRCLSGFFTHGLVDSPGTIGPGTNYGTAIVNLVG